MERAPEPRSNQGMSLGAQRHATGAEPGRRPPGSAPVRDVRSRR